MTLRGKSVATADLDEDDLLDVLTIGDESARYALNGSAAAARMGSAVLLNQFCEIWSALVCSIET